MLDNSLDFKYYLDKVFISKQSIFYSGYIFYPETGKKLLISGYYCLQEKNIKDFLKNIFKDLDNEL